MNVIDPRELRNAFGRFMTGVTVVTTVGEDGAPVGFTANSFASVSLDPPLLLVCPGRFLSQYAVFEACRHFAVSVLAEGQEEVSNTFATFKGDRFADVAHGRDRNGVPLIDGAVARFSCRTHQVVPAGDHCILIGEVEAFEEVDAPGLGYAGGKYFSLGLERAALEPGAGAALCGAIMEDREGRVLLQRTADGFRPPQVMLRDRGSLRDDLTKGLAAMGLSARVGRAYSVYVDRESGLHYAYFLGEGQVAETGAAIEAVAVEALPELTYATPAIATMMLRFGLEAQARDFSIYLGDAHSGDVHRMKDGG